MSGRDVDVGQEECLRRGRVREDMAEVGRRRRRWREEGVGRTSIWSTARWRKGREKETVMVEQRRNPNLFSSQSLLLLSCLLLPGTVSGTDIFGWIDAEWMDDKRNPTNTLLGG